MSDQLDRIEAAAEAAARAAEAGSARLSVLDSRVESLEGWRHDRDRGIQCTAGLQSNAAIRVSAAGEAGQTSAWRGWAGWLISAIVGGLIAMAYHAIEAGL